MPRWCRESPLGPQTSLSQEQFVLHAEFLALQFLNFQNIRSGTPLNLEQTLLKPTVVILKTANLNVVHVLL